MTLSRATSSPDALIENIGIGGAAIVLGARALPDEIVTVSLTAPTRWDPLLLRSRIAWATEDPPYRAGIAFLHESAESALALHELIAALAFD